MTTVFGFSLPLIFGQLLIGMINGALYAMLSLGLALIFGMLNVVNMAHGAQFMLGAFLAWGLLQYAGIGYWAAFLVVPLVIGLFGLALEVTLLRRIYKLDHIYGLLLTLGVALVIEGIFRNIYGSTGVSYAVPESLDGAWNLGFMFLPIYRAWVVAVALFLCVMTWFVIERTRLGSYLRAATENPALVRAFGINVPRMIALTYAGGVALAALSGVLSAPIYSVSPQMGASIVITVFAVVVIGGMGSIRGAIAAGFGLGVLEGAAKVVWPQASGSVIFVVMALVLLLRPAGLFGKIGSATSHSQAPASESVVFYDLSRQAGFDYRRFVAMLAGCALLCVLPFVFYPVLLMKIMCFALFAAAFNLLAGGIGLLSFGHAAFFGGAAYVTGYTAKALGLPPELAIVAGGATAGLAGVAIGWLAIRRSGIYFSMITLALAQLLYFIFVQAPFTNGEDGIQRIPRGYLLNYIDLRNDLAMYFFVLVIFLLGIGLIVRVSRSPVGLAINGIKEHEPRAISLGYQTDRIKLFVFALSAFLSGIAGGTKAIVFGSASLVDAGWGTSGEVVLMTLIGGMGTVLGPVVGAAIVVLMQNLLVGLGGWVTVTQGLIFIACVLLFRRGVVGELSARIGIRA